MSIFFQRRLKYFFFSFCFLKFLIKDLRNSWILVGFDLYKFFIGLDSILVGFDSINFWIRPISSINASKRRDRTVILTTCFFFFSTDYRCKKSKNITVTSILWDFLLNYEVHYIPICFKAIIYKFKNCLFFC